MKKIVFLMMVVGLVWMVGCKKTEEGEGPSGGNGTDTAAVVKHNVELVYGQNLSDWNRISFDTLRKYSADSTVDTVFMVLERETQFSGFSLNVMLRVCDSLEVRHNINQNKIFGKGTMELLQASVNERVRDVLENKLKYKIREI